MPTGCFVLYGSAGHLTPRNNGVPDTTWQGENQFRQIQSHISLLDWTWKSLADCSTESFLQCCGFVKLDKRTLYFVLMFFLERSPHACLVRFVEHFRWHATGEPGCTPFMMSRYSSPVLINVHLSGLWHFLAIEESSRFESPSNKFLPSPGTPNKNSNFFSADEAHSQFMFGGTGGAYCWWRMWVDVVN